MALAFMSVLGPAAAEVYSTPGGEAKVATAGEDVYAENVAISNGGNSTALIAVGNGGEAYATCIGVLGFCLFPGVAVNTTGTTSGASWVAVSGTGDANGGVAGVSGTGNVNGGYLATWLAVSGAGNASGEKAAVSGLGAAVGHVAVSGTGHATGYDKDSYVTGAGMWVTEPGTAASLGGNATGSVAVSVLGDAHARRADTPDPIAAVAGSGDARSDGVLCLTVAGDCYGQAEVKVSVLGRSDG